MKTRELLRAKNFDVCQPGNSQHWSILFAHTVKPRHLSTSIQREPPLSLQILVLPIAFTPN